MLVLGELFAGYLRKELKQANHPISRSSILAIIYEWQSKVDLTGIDAEHLALVSVGLEMVLLQLLVRRPNP